MAGTSQDKPGHAAEKPCSRNSRPAVRTVNAFIGSRIGFSAALLTGVGAYAIGLLSITLATRAREPAAIEALEVGRARAGQNF